MTDGFSALPWEHLVTEAERKAFLRAWLSNSSSILQPTGRDWKRGAMVELTKTIEMIGFPGDPAIEIYMSFQGVRGKESCSIREVWLENLLDMDIRLGKLKHIIFGDQIDTFEFDTVFSLFELIDGISWQLSFHNMPVECRISI